MKMGKNRIKLIRMEDPYTDLKKGDMGTIIGKNPIGDILVKWDNGSNLTINPNIDEYEIVERLITRFKMFEFKESDIGFFEVKFQEISDIISSYDGVYFDWYIIDESSTKFGASIEVSSEKVKIDWCVDLDKMSIEETTVVDGDSDIWWDKISSYDEAFHIIEKEIYYWLDISERIKLY